MTGRWRTLPWATLALVGTATAAVELAQRRPDDTGPLWLAWALSEVIVAVAVAGFTRRMTPDRSPLILATLAGLLALPFVLEPVYRWLGPDGRPLELLMLAAMRNLTLGLVAVSGWPLCRRLAAFASLFLLLFALGLCDPRGPTAWLIAAYASAGIYWLMAEHWRETVGSSARLPWTALALVTLPLAASLTVASAGPARVANVLAELLPTSGGTGDYDPFARGGVNDGDDETRGSEKSQSTGFTESDSYLDSPLPSLYDVFNDMYGEPYKPRETERAIPLTPDRVIRPEQSPSDNLRPNREFAAARRPPRDARRPLDRSTNALFQIRGRVPMHVRGAAYDLYDGRSWHEAAEGVRNCLVEADKTGPSHWFTVVSLSDGSYLAPPERHEFRTAKLRGRLVPTPPWLTRFRVGKVDRVDFFTWGQERILMFAGRETPSGITVETDSRVPDWRLTDDAHFAGAESPYASACGEIPESAAVVKVLAAEWAGRLPRGKPQISEIVRRLREDYVVDRTAAPPADADPHADFLTATKRGTDYQFAGSAVLLLRALGYRARLVSGWYADPAKFDPLTGHTPVGKYDVHFWPEVLYGSTWLLLEPTPGYELLAPAPTWTDRLAAGLLWLWNRKILLAAFGLVTAVAWVWRHELLDRASVAAYRCRRYPDWRQRSWAALRLIERRAKWAGRPRPVGWSPGRWCERAGGPRGLAELVGLAAYAPAQDVPHSEVTYICQSALDTWTLQAFRQTARKAAR